MPWSFGSGTVLKSLGTYIQRGAHAVGRGISRTVGHVFSPTSVGNSLLTAAAPIAGKVANVLETPVARVVTGLAADAISNSGLPFGGVAGKLIRGAAPTARTIANLAPPPQPKPHAKPPGAQLESMQRPPFGSNRMICAVPKYAGTRMGLAQPFGDISRHAKRVRLGP